VCNLAILNLHVNDENDRNKRHILTYCLIGSICYDVLKICQREVYVNVIVGNAEKKQKVGGLKTILHSPNRKHFLNFFSVFVWSIFKSENVESNCI
jgi:hypothetical protein